jgi:hypothetical protein
MLWRLGGRSFVSYKSVVQCSLCEPMALLPHLGVARAHLPAIAAAGKITTFLFHFSLAFCFFSLRAHVARAVSWVVIPTRLGYFKMPWFDGEDNKGRKNLIRVKKLDGSCKLPNHHKIAARLTDAARRPQRERILKFPAREGNTMRAPYGRDYYSSV